MSTFHLDRLTDYLTGENLLLAVLWSGPVVWLVVLIVLVRCKWNRSHPLAKWAILSLLAHNILFAYATTVTIAAGGGGRRQPPTVTLSVVDGAEDTTAEPAAATQAEAWQAFPTAEPPDPRIEALERPQAASTPDLDRQNTGDLVELPRPDGLAHLPPADAQRPIHEALAKDDPRRHLSPGGGASPIEAIDPQRRDADENPLATDFLSPDRRVDTADDAMPRRTAAGDVPADLFEPHRTPPRMSDVPVTSDPAEALADARDVTTRGQNVSAVVDPLEAMFGVDAEPGTTGRAGRPVHPASQRSGSNADGAGQGPPAEPVSPPAKTAVERRAGDHAQLPTIYRFRVAPNRDEIVQRQGGGRDTEVAVRAALKWLAANQSQDGRWEARLHGGGREARIDGHDRGGAGGRADTAITGLALLAFLGGGHTHLEGDYQETVRRGLEFLLRSQSRTDGNLGGRATTFAFMYSHAMATFALSEAYAITGDDRLRNSVTMAIRYTVNSQNARGGGWRYRPGDAGDTSQLGWQVMSLKSAELAGIPIPQSTRQGIRRFLKSVSSGRHGGRASYQPHRAASRTMTAEALFCRQLLDLDNYPAAAREGGDYILQSLPDGGRANLYYWYYATLAMHQLEGESWTRWNEALKTALVQRQETRGELAGSWSPDTTWGSYGGRVYSTAMAALCLEVYYRYLPVYGQAK